MTGRRRPVLAATAGLLAVPLIAACGGEDVRGTASPASPSSSPSPSSSASPSPGTDLAPGLLPPEAFGAGAQVTPLTEAQLEQGAAMAGGTTGDLQVTPPECEPAVQAASRPSTSTTTSPRRSPSPGRSPPCRRWPPAARPGTRWRASVSSSTGAGRCR